MDNRAQIRQWVGEILSEGELQSYFLIELHVSAAHKVELFLDGDAGIDLAACRRVSRALEERLDESGILGDNYTLEVSSPGVTRPLRLARQYPQHKGRSLQVALTDDTQVEGRLLEAGPDTLQLEVPVAVKGRKKTLEVRTIPLGQVREAHVKISFK
jgi:ribosome maturation factor RimP